MTFCLVGCDHRVLEHKDVLSFGVQQISSTPLKIKLSGLVGHSALGIYDISTSENDKSLHVIVYLALATNELSGNLDYVLTIPDSVDIIVFGNEKKVIWSRY
jgi:hypothetical protein